MHFKRSETQNKIWGFSVSPSQSEIKDTDYTYSFSPRLSNHSGEYLSSSSDALRHDKLHLSSQFYFHFFLCTRKLVLTSLEFCDPSYVASKTHTP